MRGVLAACLLTCLLACAARAAESDPAWLADRIDELLADSWRADGVIPAPPADDAEFHRRAWLDLTGRIPTVRAVHDFLADSRHDKRERLIDDLLDHARHAVHFANVWRGLLIPEANTLPDARYFVPGFETWLRERRRASTGLDDLVRELVAVPLAPSTGAARPVLADLKAASPLAFYALKDAKPEGLAASTSRLFLGIQIECAQCHDHPFARWSHREFWSQAAFFAGIERRGKGVFAPLVEDGQRRQSPLMDTDELVPASFLGTDSMTLPAETGARQALAEWITADDNPFFARAMVNRVWGQLMGRGLIEPVDDLRDDNPPSHPELLDTLARAFVESGHDLTYLYRAIGRSQAYGRASARTDATQDDPSRFARMTVKGMSAEQFIDSLLLATGTEIAAGGRSEPREAALRELAALFDAASGGDRQSSVPQALALMNGRFISEAVAQDGGGVIAALRETPGLDDAARVEALFLATLSRPPSDDERVKVLEYISASGPDMGRRLSDLLWSLLNTAEFRFNH